MTSQRYNQPDKYKEKLDQQSEIRRLKAELKRVTKEKDILKNAAGYFARESG